MDYHRLKMACNSLFFTILCFSQLVIAVLMITFGIVYRIVGRSTVFYLYPIVTGVWIVITALCSIYIGRRNQRRGFVRGAAPVKIANFVLIFPINAFAYTYAKFIELLVKHKIDDNKTIGILYVILFLSTVENLISVFIVFLDKRKMMIGFESTPMQQVPANRQIQQDTQNSVVLVRMTLRPTVEGTGIPGGFETLHFPTSNQAHEGGN